MAFSCIVLQQKEYDLVMDEEIQFVLADSVAGNCNEEVITFYNFY